MRRIAAAVVLVVVAIAIWRMCGSAPSEPPAEPAHANRRAVFPVVPWLPKPWAAVAARGDGAVAGTVRTGDGSPIAHARVCIADASEELAEEPQHADCVIADDAGRYAIEFLPPDDYAVSASARGYLPARHTANDTSWFVLARGERRTRVDVVLPPGGVEITGIVVELDGDPIAGARVRADSDNGSTGGDADETGRFRLWVPAGAVTVVGQAEGFGLSYIESFAPGDVRLVLLPASTIAGTVVDAETRAPVAGARVSATDSDGFAAIAITDLSGSFELGSLTPDRYRVEARTEHGHGRAGDGILLGLGEHVAEVDIALERAHRIEGRVVSTADRPDCSGSGVVELTRDDVRIALHRDDRGNYGAVGVPSGQYAVKAWCHDHYASERQLVIDRDRVGQVWEVKPVQPRSTIRGRVLTPSGDPVAGARVSTWSHGVAEFHAVSDGTGRFAITDLTPDLYELRLGRNEEAVVQVAVASGATVEQDLVTGGGAIRGVVVDARGAPVRGAEVAVAGERLATDAAGAFAIAGLGARTYLVQVARSASTLPIAMTDVVVTDRVESVRIALPSGVLRGSVVDRDGAPIAGAVVSARVAALDTPDAGWERDAPPVPTGADGSFAIDDLSPGIYAVRAFRLGGGEAHAQGSTAGPITLRFR